MRKGLSIFEGQVHGDTPAGDSWDSNSIAVGAVALLDRERRVVTGRGEATSPTITAISCVGSKRFLGRKAWKHRQAVDNLDNLNELYAGIICPDFGACAS